MSKANKNTYFNSITQFKFFQTKRLGKGSFGEVKLALHLQTSKIYAIKIIDSNQVTTQIGTKALEKQIALHTSINHPHIIKVWQVLKERSKIYMIMEYAQKGNLFYYQNQKKTFSEEDASVFFTQVLSAIEYLHSLNLIHRDIKPQNLLLDKDLNIKICDLGWITEGINNMHMTFCGTYQYMAPQMIFEHSYDHKIDIWALGVLLYQLLHGCAPFQGQKVEQVRAAMLEGQIQIDPDLSENVQNLIFNILKVDPTQRLSIKGIKSHPWIIDMKKRKLLSMTSILNKQAQQQLSNEFQNFKRYDQPHAPGLSKKRYQSLKSIQRKAIMLLKKKKNLNKNIKINHSTQQLKVNKLSKQKGKIKQKKIVGKIVKQISTKKLIGGHKSQKSQFSQILKQSRLKTELKDAGKTMKYYQFARFNTQAGQGIQPLDQRSTIKKRNIMGKKNDLYSTNGVKSGEKIKLTRKSID